MHKIKNILLAEDDPDDSFLFQEALSIISENTNLELVQDGEMLLEWLSKSGKIPDLIFLDLNMPRKDGHTCLLEIRSIEKFKNLPVIILSTSANEQSVNNAFSGGANLYIRKPDNFNDLVKAVNFVIDNSEKLKEKVVKESFLLPL